MCKVREKPYWVDYQGIDIPVRLTEKVSVDERGHPTFIVKVGDIKIGHHWCVHCVNTPNSTEEYETCEECIGRDMYKFKRILRSLVDKPKSLDEKEFRELIDKEFNTNIRDLYEEENECI